MSLRAKMLLAASVLLVVPFVGYRYVIAMDQFLRDHQASAALDSARTLALALHGHPELHSLAVPDERSTLFVQPIAGALPVDGYAEEWSTLPTTAHAAGVRLRAASDGQALFLLVQIPLARSDPVTPQLRIVLEDAPAFRRAWWLDASIPGPVVVREVPPAPAASQPAHADPRLKGAAQRRQSMLNVEIRIPLSLGIAALYFEVIDPRSPDTVAARVPRRDSFHVRFAPQQLAQLLRSWAPTAGRRLRVIDDQARVVAQAGDITRDDDISTLGAVMERFIDAQDDGLLSLAPVTLKLSGAEVDAALSGRSAVRIRRAVADGPLVVSAAWPLREGDDARAVGALILEESTSPAQALGRRALLELFVAAAAAFLLGTAVLLAISGRLVARLRALRNQAASTIDESGRVYAAFDTPLDRDEIGDLGRSFGAAVSRLQGYQDYLEQLAQRLSHELRTPLTVIRTSLDNLSMTAAGRDDSPYIERAQAGVERLDSIIRRMSEAARLEQAMADTERHDFDLVEVIQALLPAYQQSWPGHEFAVNAATDACVVHGSDELIAQALDKLLSNARDFADPQSTIEIHVASAAGVATMMVCNSGPALPDGDASQLFESMNSRRSASCDEPGESHLGLGLYVVRLVAEFHAGRAFARGDAQHRRVCVGMELPTAGRA